MQITAPAKINLALHVTGQRADGYHLLDSLAVFTAMGDQLTLEAADTLSLDITGPQSNGLAADESNLVIRAAQALRQAVDKPSLGARMELHKQLPIAAGIGGGSADAAAALKGLNALWGLDLPASDMHQLALDLGADIPMCLNSQPARIGGIGDEIQSLDMPTFHLVLANPGVQVPTPTIFKALTNKQNAPLQPDLPVAGQSAKAWIDYLPNQRNDLQAAAIAAEPVIADCLAQLEGQPHCHLARMSGSGATCFGLFEDRPSAELAATAIKRNYPHWWVVPTHSTQHPARTKLQD